MSRRWTRPRPRLGLVAQEAGIETPLDTLRPARLLVRLAPMIVVAWTRTYAVLLPGIMETYEMSPSTGGRFIALVEGGSFLSLFLLGFAIERLGAVRILLLGLPVCVVALLITTSLNDLLLVAPALLLLGSGMAWTVTGINTLMASTGQQRSFYLGIMHATFSGFSVVAPLLAGAVLMWRPWQDWYRGVSLLAAILVVLVWRFEFRSTAEGRRVATAPSVSQEQSGSVLSIASIYLGVFALTGVQGVFNAWSYLYVLDVYETEPSFARLAPACFWVGVLVGRLGLIRLTRGYSARTLLIASSLLPAVTMTLEQLLALPAFTLLAMLITGMGVSGAFQLGTQWAAERLPRRIAAASTGVMAFAWLGIGLSPWFAGMVIEAASYRWLLAIVLTGCGVAAASFTLTPSK